MELKRNLPGGKHALFMVNDFTLRSRSFSNGKKSENTL